MKIIRAATPVVPVAAPGFRGFVDSRVAPFWPAEPEALESFEGARVFKRSSSTLVLGVRLGECDVVVKRHRKKRWVGRMMTVFRVSRAVTAYASGVELRRLGVRVPCPLGAVESRRLGLLRRSWFLTEEVAPAETLHAFVCRVPAGDPARVPVARRLGRLIGLIHGSGRRNRDLKAPNFLVGPRHRVWLVDLDGVLRADRASIIGHRARDLARLQRDVLEIGRPSRNEIRAFLRGYRSGVRRAASGRI
jgi:tRNA A-37 threonylcarbamoyl transferase component Bud32